MPGGFYSSKLVTMVTIQLQGAFRVEAENGEDLTPRGNKARGILVLLALSPGFSRSRDWIQDKLWSDRSDGQAKGSLRQSLAEIRRAFGVWRDVLVCDNRTIALNPAFLSFDICVEELKPLAGEEPVEGVDLLEDMSIRDVEFQNWLRDVQLKWSECLQAERSQAGTGQSNTGNNANPVLIQPEFPGALVVSGNGGTPQDRAFSDVICGWITQNLLEAGFPVTFEKLDEEQLRGCGRYRIVVTVVSSDHHSGISARAETPENIVVWSETTTLDQRLLRPEQDPAVIRILHESVDALLARIVADAEKREVLSAPVLAAIGARYLFSLGASNLSQSQRLFRLAHERDKRGIYLAWKACLNAMIAGETPGADQLALKEEAEALISDAMQLEPHNATALALCAHASNFLSRDFFTGYELSRRALERSPFNPLALTVHATSNFYLGRIDEADKLAKLSCSVSSNGPFRYFADTSRVISAALNREYEDATRLAKVTHVLKPEYLPPLRYLVLLSLKRNDIEGAVDALAKLRKISPNLSLEQIRENSAKVPGFASSDLFSFDLSELT